MDTPKRRETRVQIGGDDPLSSLPPTAQRLVAAARRVLARDGFNALTVEAVASESGEYRDSIRYYFGSKSGLIAAVIDSLAHDQSLGAAGKTSDVQAGEDRIHAIVEADRNLAEDRQAFRDFYEIVPHALKDEELRDRVAALYAWYRRLYVRPFTDAASEQRLLLLNRYASLMTAVVDGLALQKALDPDQVDLGELFALWEEMLRITLGKIIRENEGER